jgi:hypothetical protein
MTEEFIEEINGKKFVNLEEILPRFTVFGRPIVKEKNEEKLVVYTPHPGRGKGVGSKKITLPRQVELRASLVRMAWVVGW